jgi:protein-disulfide isomerase
MEEEKQEKTITLKKSDLWKYSTFLLIAVLVVGGIFMFTGKGSSTAGTGNAVQQPSNGKVSVNLNDLIDSNTPVIGSKNAPVTVVEFSDFSCPYCAAASGDNAELVAYMQQRDPSWKPIVTNLMNDVKDGKVRLAVKYSPGHSGGQPAQLVAWCLNDQSSDLYWKFYPKAFASQTNTAKTDNANVESLSDMKTIANSIGADMTKLQSCLDSKKYESRFSQEQNDGSKVGISGTPGFLVGKTNGNSATIIAGAVSYTDFQQVINSQ